MHRLVRMTLNWWLERHGQRKAWVDTAAARVEALVPCGGQERREIWIAYLPHALHVVGLENTLDSAFKARILERIGQCQESNGQYVPAESAHRQALEGYEKVLRREHPHTLTSVYHLAHLLAQRHHICESLSLYQRACAGYSATLKNNHPTTRACSEHYSKLCESKEQHGLTFLSASSARDIAMSTQKVSRSSRGLVKLGILCKHSKYRVRARDARIRVMHARPENMSNLDTTQLHQYGSN
ncbi:hypothetical protein PSPO01_15979 [Paraphaeosphaeria sporulosa]